MIIPLTSVTGLSLVLRIFGVAGSPDARVVLPPLRHWCGYSRRSCEASNWRRSWSLIVTDASRRGAEWSGAVSCCKWERETCHFPSSVSFTTQGDFWMLLNVLRPPRTQCMPRPACSSLMVTHRARSWCVVEIKQKIHTHKKKTKIRKKKKKVHPIFSGTVTVTLDRTLAYSVLISKTA